MNDQSARRLLMIQELGGYPDFSPLYQSAGYKVSLERSMRQALKAIKKCPPDIIVTEFNFQSDFRDRTSSLESLLAVVQRLSSCTVIIFYDREFSHQLDKVVARFPRHVALPFPVDATALERAVKLSSNAGANA